MLPSHLAQVNPKNPEFLVGTGPFKFKNRIPEKSGPMKEIRLFHQRTSLSGRRGSLYNAVDTTVDAFCGGRLSMTNLRYGLESKTAMAKIKAHAPDAITKLKPVGVLRGVVFNTAD